MKNNIAIIICFVLIIVLSLTNIHQTYRINKLNKKVEYLEHWDKSFLIVYDSLQQAQHRLDWTIYDKMKKLYDHINEE